MDGREIFSEMLILTENIADRREKGQTYFDLHEKTTEINKYFNKYGVTYAVVRYPYRDFSIYGKQMPFNLNTCNLFFPRSSWALVYWDDNSLVFVKRILLNDKIIRSFEYKFLWPYNLHQMFYLLNAGELYKKQVAVELNRHKQFVTESKIRDTIFNQLISRPAHFSEFDLDLGNNLHLYS